MLASPSNISHDGTNRLLDDDAVTGTDWLDAALSAGERAQCGDVATPRIGHDQRITWPADELRGVLERREP